MRSAQAQELADLWVAQHAPELVAHVSLVDGVHVASLRMANDDPMFGAQRLVIDDDGTVHAYPGNVPPRVTVERHRERQG